MTARFVYCMPNSDNINVTGESFGYGPQRLLPTYDPGFTVAHFNHFGLYAHSRLPNALLWNLTRLAKCLLPLGKKSALKHTLYHFAPTLTGAMTTAAVRRLGLRSKGAEGDATLSQAFWALLQQSQLGFERAFFDLRGGLNHADIRSATVQSAFATIPAALEGYDQASDASIGYPSLACFAPCTALIDHIEAIRAPTAERDDWSALASTIEETHIMRETDRYAP